MAEERFDLRKGECAALIRLSEKYGPVRFELGTGRLLWKDGEDDWPLRELLRIRREAAPTTSSETTEGPRRDAR